MRIWFPRSSEKTAQRAEFAESTTEYFDQPERSLLGEALSRPLGLVAALMITGAGAAFAVNSFVLEAKRINDFALVALFVGGGILLSTLLRAGAPHTESLSRSRTASRDQEDEAIDAQEIIFEDQAPAELQAPARQGFAEAPAMGAPVPAAAIVNTEAVKTVSDLADSEVTNFQQALLHYANKGDLHGQGEVLRRLGHLAKSRGHLKEAREFYMNSRNCFRKIEDHYAEAAVLLDLGQVLESLEEHDAASAAYRDANRALLDVAMASGDQYNAIQAHAAD